MKQRETSPLGLTAVGIAALFLAGFFLLVVFGAQSYRDTVTGQENNMRSRALMAYIETAVKANDSQGAVAVIESPYGQALVIRDGDTAYALRIYCCNGQLLEDFGRVDAALNPAEAQVIGQTERFVVELGGSLLNVQTDAGRLLVQLRSEGGKAA